MNMTSAIKRSFILLFVLMFLLPVFSVRAMMDRDSSLTFGMVAGSSEHTNPLISAERDMQALGSLVYEGLVFINDDYAPQPQLAQRWETSGEGTTWTFYLKEGITFHDGSPVLASDVEATIKEILRLATEDNVSYRGPYTSLKYFINSVKATAENTVEIKTNRKNYGFLFAMTFPILPASSLQAYNPPGTGPYVMANYVPGDYMMLTANPNWWGGTSSLQEIMTIFHATGRELVSSYEYNRVDAIITRALNAAQYRSGVNTLNISYRTRQLETLLFNNQSYELQEVKVRKAIRFAINIEGLVNSSYLGMVTRSDTLMPQGTWMQGGVSSVLRQDIQRAKSLLAQAGWDNPNEEGILTQVIGGQLKKLSLRFIVYDESGDGARLSTAQQISGMLQNVGIEARVINLPFSDAQARLKAGNYDLALAAFSMDAVPDPGFLLISGNTGNYMRYASGIMDKLFTQLRSALTREAYTQKLYEIQARFVEDCPFVSLYYRNGAIITRQMFSSARDLREPDILRGIEGTR
ncbi:MAG: peptide ABC transporter substrate-binding protein [Clostridiales bacterium]|nr:peptide ABC transporter substrate-binding protein [Clostridiales bacterium]